MAESKSKESNEKTKKLSLYFNYPNISLILKDNLPVDYHIHPYGQWSLQTNTIYINWFLTKDLHPNFKLLPVVGTIEFTITEEENPKLFKILELINHTELFNLLIKDYFSSHHCFNYFTNKIKNKDDTIRITSSLKYN